MVVYYVREVPGVRVVLFPVVPEQDVQYGYEYALERWLQEPLYW